MFALWALRCVHCPLRLQPQVSAPSPETGTLVSVWSSRGHHRIHLFWHLREKQQRHGLLEVCPGHKLHQLTSMMQTGLWAATQVSMEQPPKVSEIRSPGRRSGLWDREPIWDECQGQGLEVKSP